MDGGSDGHSTIWSRLSRFFGHDDEESLEKAILEARADGEVEPDEESMLLGILRFNDLQVQDTMIPRTDIDCVPDDMPLPEVARVIVDSGHSRIPVYKDTRDNMVAFCMPRICCAASLNRPESSPGWPRSCASPFSCRKPSPSARFCRNSVPASSISPSPWTNTAAPPA